MKRSLLLTLLAPVVAASSLHAASDMFLKIDGVKGESSDERHKDQIEILSFSWGSTNSAIGSGSSGGGEGKASFSELHFTTSMSMASPQLLMASAGTNHFKNVILTMRKSGSSREDYY